MKKHFAVIVFLALLCTLHGQSVGDFTIINTDNNRMYNYYDDPSVFFSCVGEVVDFSGIEKEYHKEFQVKGLYKGIIWHHEIPLSERFREHYGKYVANPEKYFDFSYLEVFKGFKTPRGVGIGDKVENVIKAYPEALFYKKTSKNSVWKNEDCYWENEIKVDVNNLPNNLGYVVLKKAFFQHNRGIETNYPMHYYLVFVLDTAKRVSSIILHCIPDAL